MKVHSNQCFVIRTISSTSWYNSNFSVRGARFLPMADDECPLCLDQLVGLPTVTFPCCQLVTHGACLGVNILQGPCPQCRARPHERAAVAESRRQIGEMLRKGVDPALDGIRTPPIWCMLACCAAPMTPEWPQVAPADERLMVQCQCAYTSCSPPFTAMPTYFRFLDNAQPSVTALPHPAYTILNRAAGFIGRRNRAYQTAMSL